MDNGAPTNASGPVKFASSAGWQRSRTSPSAPAKIVATCVCSRLRAEAGGRGPREYDEA